YYTDINKYFNIFSFIYKIYTTIQFIWCQSFISSESYIPFSINVSTEILLVPNNLEPRHMSQKLLPVNLQHRHSMNQNHFLISTHYRVYQSISLQSVLVPIKNQSNL